MAAVSSIVLPDAQATPVNHTFIPLGPDRRNSDVWWFEDQSSAAATPLGFNRLSISLSRSAVTNEPMLTASNRVIRFKGTLHTPIMETLSNNSAGLIPAPTVAYVPFCKVEFTLPERCTLQNRKDLRKYVVGLLGNTLVVDMLENLANVY